MLEAWVGVYNFFYMGMCSDTYKRKSRVSAFNPNFASNVASRFFYISIPNLKMVSTVCEYLPWKCWCVKELSFLFCFLVSISMAINRGLVELGLRPEVGSFLSVITVFFFKLVGGYRLSCLNTRT